MKTRIISNCLRAAFISLSLVITFCMPVPSSAARNAVVSVSIPSQPVSPGSQFTINVTVQPNNAIAGVQFHLSFNPSLVSVNSITEGNLLKQNGASTFFTPGQINNSAGTITGVAGTITNPGQTVTTEGTFAVINMTANSTGGTCALTLSKVILGDTSAQAVPVMVNSGQVVVVNPITPPVIGGGGGGGGGGGAVIGPSPTPQPTTPAPTPTEKPTPTEEPALTVEPTPVESEPVITLTPVATEYPSATASQYVARPAEESPALNDNTGVPSPETESPPVSQAPVQNAGTYTFRLSLLIEIISGFLVIFAITAGLILFYSRRLQRKALNK